MSTEEVMSEARKLAEQQLDAYRVEIPSTVPDELYQRFAMSKFACAADRDKAMMERIAKLEVENKELRKEISELEASPMSEEALDIVRSQLAAEKAKRVALEEKLRVAEAVISAAKHVVEWDWSDNVADCVNDISRLESALAKLRAMADQDGK